MEKVVFLLEDVANANEIFTLLERGFSKWRTAETFLSKQSSFLLQGMRQHRRYLMSFRMLLLLTREKCSLCKGTETRSEPDVPTKATIESLQAMPMEALVEGFRENNSYESFAAKESKPQQLTRSPLSQVN
ncbi:unnamed protein product [Brassica napus]|uniref:(rape) hypothetical protein n=2 Tax=Brassica napus TaxID=3708 RepID=A0A816I021_BRANA|nr:unnamed protein product [Brassica napus]